MLNLENWAWAECQLGSVATKSQQFNLHGEKRKSVGKRGKGDKREKEGMENKVKKKQREKIKTKVNRYMWIGFIYIQE